MIECLNLSKSFDSRTVLDNINLIISQGKIFGIIGPNGAGKTTIARILCGLILPNKGKFNIGGFNGLEEIEKIRNIMGYMPQIFSLYGDLTVYENLYFFSKIYGVGYKEFLKRKEKLLAFTRLKKFENRQAGKLSGGMYKKLAVACALIFQPQYLLLDEPTIGVDPVSRRELWDILFDLVHEGMTIVMTTSYMDEAERCDRIALLNEGKIVVEGTPRALKTNLPLQGFKLITPKGRELKNQLEKLPGIFNLDIQGSEINLFYPKDITDKNTLRKNLKTNQIDFDQLEEIEPYFEEVFTYYKSNYEQHNS